MSWVRATGRADLAMLLPNRWSPTWPRHPTCSAGRLLEYCNTSTSPVTKIVANTYDTFDGVGCRVLHR